MTQRMSPSKLKAKISSTVSLKDSSVSTKERPDRRHPVHILSDEMISLNKQLSVLQQLTKPRQDQTVEKRNGESILHSLTGNYGKQSIEAPKYKDKHGIAVLYDAAMYEQGNLAEPDAVSVLSHELMSPLTLIKGYSATLLQLADAITEEQRVQYLQGISTATDRVIRLMENLRDVSQFEITTSNLVVQSTSLPDLLRKTVHEIQSQTTKHVIKLRHFGPLPLVKVDRQKIEQVMTNLLINAVKYSPQGGDIKVVIWQAYSQRELEEELGGAPPLEFPCLIVSVTDSGIGIPEAELGNIFKRFYRVDNRFTRIRQGSGLGLYICKALVEAHGGHIWVKSTPHEGSTFSFSLPWTN